MQVPSSLQAGENFKQATVLKINQIIEYLKTQRLTSPNQSIKIDQLVNGIGITVNATGGASPSLRQDKIFKHPFRLFTGVDSDNWPTICVQSGGIKLQGVEAPYNYIECGYQEPPVEGAPPTTDYYIPIEDWREAEDGYYGVWLSIYETTDELDPDPHPAAACFITSAVNFYVPEVPGFINIPLGVIEKRAVSSSSSSENEEQDEQPPYMLAVCEQFIYGDITIDYSYMYLPFALRLFVEWDETKIFKFSDTEVKVNGGMVFPGRIYDNLGYSNVEDQDGIEPEKTDDGKTYYCFLFNNQIKWVENVNGMPLSSDSMILAKFFYSKNTLAYEQFYLGNINVSEKYPFKAFIELDDNDKQRVSFYNGQVFFISNNFMLVNFNNSNFNFDFSTLADGDYGVIGVVKEIAGDVSPSIIVVSDNVTTNDIPNIPGYRVFTICGFTKTTDEDDETVWRLQINYQYQLGNLIMYDHHCDEAFYPCFNVSAGADSALKTSASDFVIDSVKLKDGAVIDNNTNRAGQVTNFLSAVVDSGFNVSNVSAAIAYVECTKSGTEWSKQITWNTSSANYVEYTSGTANINKINIPVANFRKINNQVFVEKIDGLPMPTIDHKVKVVGPEDSRFQQDAKPDYLVDKVLTERLIQSAGDWPVNAGGNSLNGYTTRKVEGQGGDENLLILWDYPHINGYTSDTYKTMNLNNGDVVFEDQGKIRLNENESAARFLPDVVSAVEPLYISSSNQQLIFSANMSNYVSAITTSGSCISATVQSQTSMGKSVNINLDKPCLFEDFNISGTDPIITTGSGNNWNIAFNDSDFIKSVSGTNCINASKNGTTANISLDKACVFQDFNISGTAPINVTGSGNNWNVGINNTNYLENISGTNCINATKNGTTATVSLDKNCVFQDFSITGTSPVNVTGSGNNWNVGFNDSDFVKNVTGGTCINASKSGSTVNVGVDVNCVLQNLSINGGTDISVTKNGNSYTVNYTGSNTSSGGKNVIAGTCLSATSTTSSVTLNVDKQCVFQNLSIQGGNKINVTGSGENWTIDWVEDSSSSGGSSGTTGSVNINGNAPIEVTSSTTSGTTTFTISLSVSGTGLLVVSNGQITPIAVPSTNAVLTAGPNGLQWMPYNTCQSACDNGTGDGGVGGSGGNQQEF